MTKQQANRILSAILTTISEAGAAGAPSGSMYAALMSTGVDLDTYQTLIQIASTCGLIVVSRSHVVTLTAKGHATVAKINAAAEAS